MEEKKITKLTPKEACELLGGTWNERNGTCDIMLENPSTAPRTFTTSEFKNEIVDVGEMDERVEEESAILLEQEGIINREKCLVKMGDWESDLYPVNEEGETWRDYHGNVKIQTKDENDLTEFDAKFFTNLLETQTYSDGSVKEEAMYYLSVSIPEYKIPFIKKVCK